MTTTWLLPHRTAISARRRNVVMKAAGDLRGAAGEAKGVLRVMMVTVWRFRSGNHGKRQSEANPSAMSVPRSPRQDAA